MSFHRDDAFQREIRDLYLKPYYRQIAHEGRFFFVEGKSESMMILQKELHTDTLLQTADGGRRIDEKIVRWPEDGKELTAYALDTWSCINADRWRQGWMFAENPPDILAWVFVRPEDVVVHLIPFRALQNWFVPVQDDYPKTRSKQSNRSECRVVPIRAVVEALPPYRMDAIRLLPEGDIEVTKAPLPPDRRRGRRSA